MAAFHPHDALVSTYEPRRDADPRRRRAGLRAVVARRTRERGPGRRGSRRATLEAREPRQLDEYFAGTRTGFDLPLDLHGTPFQLAAWHALAEIPYGETRSYAEQAARLGRPAAVRAVGAANGRNPLSIVLPCHRVIGSDGALRGFGGGLDVKAGLLAFEAASASVEHLKDVRASCARLKPGTLRPR